MLGYVSQAQATGQGNQQGVNANANFIQQQEPPQGSSMQGVQIQPNLQPPQQPTTSTPTPAMNDNMDYLMEETPVNKCIRSGCQNDAIVHSEWEDEYCSNECVVSHCKDVFNAWLAANQQNPTTT